MIDLKALRESQNRIASQRTNTGGDYNQLAFTKLAEAELGEFRDKELLKQASELFIKAIRFRRTDPEPYVGLAYLLLLVRDFDGAEAYLREALRHDRNLEDAHKLMEYLQQKRKEPASATATMQDFSGLSRDNIDYDHLYDQVELQIYTQVRLAMEYQPPDPGADSEQIAQLQQKLGEFQKAHQHLLKQLKVVDEEIDISDLQRTMRPFEIQLRRMEKALETTDTFARLHSRIDGLMKEISAVLPTLGSSPSAQHDQHVEQIMDACDQIADEIDTLEAKNYPTASLESAYGFLAMLVEQYRDAVDELAHH